MIKYSVCIDMMFAELPFYKRIQAVSDSGFKAVEIWKWSTRDIEMIKRETEKNSVEIALINIDSKDGEVSEVLWSGGILSCSDEEAVIDAVKQTMEVCDYLEIKKTIVLPGNKNSGVPYKEQKEKLIAVLRKAAIIAEKAGITIVLEPLNTYNRPEVFLSCAKEGFDIVREVDNDSIKLLYDVYHQQQMEGNIIRTISENIDLIGHIQIADVPGRHQPGTGEINFKNVLKAIGETSYEGYVGLEYIPTIATKDSFDFLSEYEQ